MSAEFQSIDEAINASYQSASQVETIARQLEARISKIDGASRHLPHRNYGQPVDLGKIRSNLTLTSLIAQNPQSWLTIAALIRQSATVLTQNVKPGCLLLSPCRCKQRLCGPKTSVPGRNVKSGSTPRAGRRHTGAGDDACKTSPRLWRLVLLPARRQPKASGSPTQLQRRCTAGQP